MSIRLLISEEGGEGGGGPLIHPKVVEVWLSQSFLTFCPLPETSGDDTALPSLLQSF